MVVSKIFNDELNIYSRNVKIEELQKVFGHFIPLNSIAYQR